MAGGFRGRMLLSTSADETKTDYTGSFPVGRADTALIQVNALEFPTGSGEDLVLQLQQSSDNVAFFDIGSDLKLSAAGLKLHTVDQITGSWLRLKASWTSGAAATETVAFDIEVVAYSSFEEPVPAVLFVAGGPTAVVGPGQVGIQLPFGDNP